ncbi:MAG: hypothetical protein E6G97_18215 [Alphaproteobacteria bacterium]|nr:MAG: hypothetical protein E6G97_18215 [Alphaproteobacteria bacterium]
MSDKAWIVLRCEICDREEGPMTKAEMVTCRNEGWSGLERGYFPGWWPRHIPITWTHMGDCPACVKEAKIA